MTLAMASMSTWLLAGAEGALHGGGAPYQTLRRRPRARPKREVAIYRWRHVQLKAQATEEARAFLKAHLPVAAG
jgi:hypothetical protein